MIQQASPPDAGAGLVLAQHKGSAMPSAPDTTYPAPLPERPHYRRTAEVVRYTPGHALVAAIKVSMSTIAALLSSEW